MQRGQAMMNRSESVWKKIAHQCGEFAQDGALWLMGVAALGVANVALKMIPLDPAQREMMESIHLNAVYATILVASAGTVSRLLVVALDRLGSWE